MLALFGFGRRFSGLGKPQKVFRDKKHLFFAVCLSKPQRNGDFFIKILFVVYLTQIIGSSGGRSQVAGSKSSFPEVTCHMQPATCHKNCNSQKFGLIHCQILLVAT
jgi:hypothetical protein